VLVDATFALPPLTCRRMLGCPAAMP